MVSKITLILLIALALATPGDSFFIKKKIAAKLIPWGIKAKLAKNLFKIPNIIPFGIKPILPIPHKIQPIHAVQHVQPIVHSIQPVYKHVYEAPPPVYEAPAHVYGAPVEVKHEPQQVHFNPSHLISIVDDFKSEPEVPEYKFSPSLGFTHYNKVKYFPIVQQPIVHPVIHPIVHTVYPPKPTYGPPPELPTINYPPPTGPYPGKQ